MKTKGSNLSSKGFFGLITSQFLGAFNDNAFKLVVSLYIISLGAGIQGDSKKVAVASAFFIIPFILFSTYAGWFSDKNSKNSVIENTKIAEIFVMSFSLLAFLSGSLILIFFVLFLMGTQSAFFSPAKYGILPEIVRDDELSRANGLLQMFTFLAIILGTAAGGILYSAFSNRLYYCSVAFILVAILGTVASYFVEDVKPAKEDKRFELNPIKSALRTYRVIKKDRPLLYTIIAIAFFWFFGALFQLNILIYGKGMMQISQGKIAYLMTIIAVGIGVGSFLAGRLSGGKVEFGLVPIGGVFMAVFCFFLSDSYDSFSDTASNLFLLGLASGFYIVPLTAYLQQKSAAEDKGENIAFSNLLSFTGILFASLYLYVMSNIFKVDPAGIFHTMGVVMVIVTLFMINAVPSSFTRAMLWLHVRLRYNVKVSGREHIPKRGAALIVCNNASFLDALIIACSLQRTVRFIIPDKYYKHFSINLICRLLKAIPAPSSGTKDFARALFKARRELENGNLVCVFPEGGVSETGSIQKFDENYIHIAQAKAPKELGSKASISVPIIPAYIDRPTRSFLGLKRFFPPRRRTVCFGSRLPPYSSAYKVKQAVSLLGREAFTIKKRTNYLLHHFFIHTAKKKFFSEYMYDTLGYSLSYGSTLAAAMAFSKKIKRRLKKDERMVGVMMPSSCIGAILNFAILMAGRVPVNLNYTAPISAIGDSIKQCRIKTVFTSGKLLKKMKIKQTGVMVLCEQFFKDVDIIVKLKEYFKALLTPAPVLKLIYKCGKRPDDLATVIFSSGSTGNPKGVMLSHLNIISNIEGVREMLPLSRDECFIGVLPFFHSFGFMAALMLPAAFGYRVAYHPNPLDAAGIGKLCENKGGSILAATPTFLAAYTRKCTTENFKTLRILLLGAEKLKDNIFNAFYDKFNLYPLEGFGCTELSPVVSVNRPDVSVDGVVHNGAKRGSVGRPLPGVTAAVTDVDSGVELGVNSEGLLLINGPNVMKGYLNDHEKTGEVIKRGWYNTGDIAKIDEDGFITITDRLSRFSKIGGEMVPHIKVENAIHDILATDNIVCVVTAVPDGKKGERLVVLFTELEMEIDELFDKLNSTDLPKLWIPRKDSFKRIDEIPILGSGKLALKRIKELADDFL